MAVQFDEPYWLLLLLLGIPVVYIASTQLRALHRARVASVIVLRLLLVASIALALAGTSRVQTNDRLAVIALVDLSESVQRFVQIPGFSSTPEALKHWLQAATGDRLPDDSLGIVGFAQQARALAAARSDTLPPDQLTFSISNTQGTNGASALDAALAMLPPDTPSRFVMLSDGAFTQGDIDAVLRRVQAQGIRLDVVPLSFSLDHEVLIEFIETPSTSTRNTLITARVGIRSKDAMVGTLYIRREGELIDANTDAPGLGLRVALDPGLQVFTIPVEIDDRPLHRFEAIFEPDDVALDTLPDNNVSEALTVAPGAGVVLLLDGRTTDGVARASNTLADALQDAGIDVQRVAPDNAPVDLLTMQAYDLVILQNVAADELPVRTHAMLVEYVETLGGGLLMIGGPKSFGAGGWQGTELQDIMPILLDVPDQLLAPAAALVLVLDSSGSMGNHVLGGSRTKQRIANDAAAQAALSLDKRDELGVISFDSSHRAVVPLGRNADPERTAARIRSISPGGGTNMYPAMRSAILMLRDSQAPVKHIIMLSDGQADGDPGWGIEAAQNARAQGITVTTIAIGDEADTDTLRAIARAGEGTYYRILDPTTLPNVFLKEVRVLHNPLVREEMFTPKIRRDGSPILRVLPESLPALDGMVLSRARPERDIFMPIVTQNDEPVLAHWNVGLGSVAAFLSDADVWAQRWLGSPLYSTFWAQLVRQTARPASQQQASMRVTIQDGVLHVALEMVDPLGNEPLDAAQIEASVYTPEGEQKNITLRQTAPGLYEQDVQARTQGQWIVLARPVVDGQPLPPVVAGTQSPRSEEHRVLEPDGAMLASLASRTGGVVLDFDTPELAELFSREGVMPREAMLPIWPMLLIVTMVLALLDIATRRIAWDRLLLGERGTPGRQLGPTLATGVLGRIKASRERQSAGGVEVLTDVEPRKRKPRRAAAVRENRDSQPVKDDADARASLLRAKQRAREQFEEES